MRYLIIQLTAENYKGTISSMVDTNKPKPSEGKTTLHLYT